ncbi:MAG: hypothetical protein ACI8WB_002120 [Phenylobacterium sp.]
MLVEVDMTELELKESLIAIEKDQVEIRKLVHESAKLNSESNKLELEARHYQKRNQWFEYSMVLAAIGATIAITKLFL